MVIRRYVELTLVLSYFEKKTDKGLYFFLLIGPIRGMRCTQVIEPSDPHTWRDNYFCVPTKSPYHFRWSHAGPIRGLSCIRFLEPSDPHTWRDNYLCHRRM